MFLIPVLQKIRRPFEELEEHCTMTEIHNAQISSDNRFKSFPYLHFRSDNFRFQVSKPIWLLGVGLHGPYTPDNENLHNLRIHIKIFEPLNQQFKLLASRIKECRVKIPSVILPVFLEKPVKLWPSSKTGYFINHLKRFHSC